MRIKCFVIAGLLVGAAAMPAQAYENYIPLGTGYSSSVAEVPAFDSEEGRISNKTDVYETELYFIGRKRVEDDSRMRQFFSESNGTGADTFIDY